MNAVSLFNRFIVLLFLLKGFQIGSSHGLNIFIAEDTLWCGGGNNAKTCSQLGPDNETDNCCREHDYCPYTFSLTKNKLKGDNYNGFVNNDIKPLSHCECDLRFHNCLTAQPYKRGSYFIYETYFQELAMKCFAYLPCSPDSDIYGNIWNMKANRRSGTCHEGLRVIEFNSIFDYLDFIKSEVTQSQKELIKEALEMRVDSFMSEAKKKAECVDSFPHFPAEMASDFEQRFLIEYTTTTTTTKTKANSTEIVEDKDNRNDLVLFGYTFESDHMTLMMASLVVLIAGILFSVVFVSLKAYRSLNEYISIRVNSSAADLIQTEKGINKDERIMS